MPEELDAFVKGIAIAIGIGVAGSLAALLVGRLVKKLATRWLGAGWAGYVTNLIRLGILLWTVALMLEQTGAAGLFVIVATALTGAVAIGSERLASDVVAGVKLLVFRHYQVGDLVTIGEYEGEVIQITLTYTVLQSESQQKIIIPNSLATDGVIVNHTALEARKLEIGIPVSLDQDIEDVMAVIGEVAGRFSPKLTGNKYEPQVLLKDIDTQTAMLALNVYVLDKDNPEYLESLLRLRTVNALKARGILGQADSSGA